MHAFYARLSLGLPLTNANRRGLLGVLHWQLCLYMHASFS
jgi:hypothetical protein